jgi:glycerol-3-phosphate acyltransferase PlsY
MTLPYVTSALAAYLFGSIPTGYLLMKCIRGQDIRESGSGNIGATNVARSGAKGIAAATLLLDAIKGALPVAGVSWYADLAGAAASGFEPGLASALAGICAVLGHCFPVWLRFRGGKGVATALGVFVVMAPKAVLVCVAVFVLAVAISRYVSLGSMLSAALFPVAAWWLEDGMRAPARAGAAIVISLLILVKHRDNLKRIAGGREHRLGAVTSKEQA